MGLLVSLDEKFSFRSFLTKNIFVAIVFMVFLALYSIFLKKTIVEIGYWNATVWVPILTAVFLLFTFPKFKKDIKTLRKKHTLPIVLVTLTTVFGGLAINKAYAVNVGITTVIISIPSSMILAFIMSLFWPKLMENNSSHHVHLCLETKLNTEERDTRIQLASYPCPVQFASELSRSHLITLTTVAFQ